MKTLNLIIIGLLVLFLVSCASHKEAANQAIEVAAASPEAEATDAPSREAVFTYGGRNELPGKVVLRISGDPVLFPVGYVRLVGVVGGGRPTACLEVGGKGIALEKGEEISGYRMVSIDDDHILLKR